jgi:hypothetical protein
MFKAADELVVESGTLRREVDNFLSDMRAG